MKLHDYHWTGFWHSIEKGTGNKYTAKCIYCNLELPSRPEKLHTYVLTYNSWPVTKKNSYLKERLSKMSKKFPKANNQNIFEDSINSENANIDLFEEEFNEEFSQINIEATNLEMENELAIEQFFNIGMLE
ncbi:16435_t:CDS:2 [Dentiscutata heterogama]|uniref:16435_t:CDS:1 n=1 Tax=Dentiscutata heterogama TaxID=1316150 RepID=A0ACA9LQL7_9GLOM|nr:16435_t:CDS:2 [Dentiscutata heterogama]